MKVTKDDRQQLKKKLKLLDTNNSKDMKLYRKYYYLINKNKINKKQKKYYIKNKERMLERIKQWRNNNKESIKEYHKSDKIKLYHKKYRKKNKEKIEKYQKIYRKNNKNRWKIYNKNRQQNINLNARLSNNLRCRVNDVLRGRCKKTISTRKLVGCSIEFLKIYIEKKFDKTMTWDNYGRKGWHIDHIKSCYRFDLSKPAQQRKCFNYTNLQPLWWYDNLSKGRK